MGLSRGGAGVSSGYPVVSDDMEYEQTEAAVGMEMGSDGSSGGASKLHRPTYSSMLTPTLIIITL